MTFRPIQEVLPDGRQYTGGCVDPLPEADKKNDSKNWARRIMARINRGEHVAAIAERSAREVLGLT